MRYRTFNYPYIRIDGMKIITADPWYKSMSRGEMEEFLAKPLLMRIGLVDSDGYPIVHPVWFLYRDGVLFFLSNKKSKKVMLLKNNPKIYFTIDTDKPSGVRGKGNAMLIDDDELAIDLMKQMILRYLGSIDSKVSEMLIEEAKESMVVKIIPRFFATWIHK